MAFPIPIDQPLTESQGKLISQIGSMKGLLGLPFFEKSKIAKSDRISTFDYLIRLLKSIGIDPSVLLYAFLTEFFSTAYLVNLILRATAQLAAGMGKNLDKNSKFVLPQNPSKKDKQNLIDINYYWLSSNSAINTALTALVSAAQKQLAKDLTILLFGRPKKQESADLMNSDKNRMNELVEESVCGVEIFSVSSPAYVRNEDLEYNRVKLAQKIQKGELGFNVTCQGVAITLPEDPSYLFGESLQVYLPSTSTSPAQAMQNVIKHVSNQVQKDTKGNSESNSQSSEKSFVQMLVEKLLTSITTLLKPIFAGFSLNGVPMIGFLDVVAKETGDSSFASANCFPPGSCEILSNYDKNNLTAGQKDKMLLLKILCNMLLNALLGYLMSFAISQFKKLIARYFAKRAANKIKRKIEKLKQRFNLLGGSNNLNISNMAKQAAYMSTISKVLKPSDNNFI